MSLGLDACLTAQYYAVKNSCKSEMLATLPVNTQSEITTASRLESRPDGTMTCNTFGTQTTCRQSTTEVWVNYPVVRYYDATA